MNIESLSPMAVSALNASGTVLAQGILLDIMRGAPRNADAIVNQIPGCMPNVRWAHDHGLLALAAAIATCESTTPLCTVLDTLYQRALQPTTPDNMATSVRTLAGIDLSGAVGDIHDIAHADESLWVAAGSPVGYQKNVFYRTGAPGGGDFQGPLPFAFAICWGRPGNDFNGLLRVWMGDHNPPNAHRLGDHKTMGQLGQQNLALYQPGDIYAIPDSWGPPPSNLNTSLCTGVASVLGNGVINGAGNIIWFPYPQPLACPTGKVWDAAQGKCVINAPPPTPPCPIGQHYDAQGNCVPDTVINPIPGGIHICPNGGVWDGTKCGPPPTVPPVVINPSVPAVHFCNPGEVWDGTKCVLSVPACPEGQVWDPLATPPACKPSTPPATTQAGAAGGNGALVLFILLGGGLAAGAYAYEHNKKKTAHHRAR